MTPPTTSRAERRADIPRLVRERCLSWRSVNRTGYGRREIRVALELADERPEGAIFIIPARHETCDVTESAVEMAMGGPLKWQRTAAGHPTLTISQTRYRCVAAYEAGQYSPWQHGHPSGSMQG